MIAMIVLGIIVVLILLLLFLPLTIDLVFDSKLVIKIQYMGIKVFDSAKKASKKKKSKKQDNNDNAPQKESFVKKIYKQKGFMRTIEYFSKVLKLLLEKLWWVAKRFKFSRFKLDLTVATNDAAKTAIQYGKICAAAYPVLSLLQTIIKFKPEQVNISANFDKNKFEFKTSIKVTTCAFYWIVAAVSATSLFLKLQRKESEKYERK